MLGQPSSSRDATRRGALASGATCACGALSGDGEHAHSSEQQYRRLFEQNPEPIMVYERGTLRIVAVSNAAVASYGYSRGEFLAMTINDLVPPEDRESLERFLETELSGERPGLRSGHQWRHQYKDRTVIEVEITSDDLDFARRRCRILFCQDVTERNRATVELVEARERLRTSAEEHRLLFQRNPQPMLAYDCETLRIVAVSDAATASMGYSREEFLAMTLLDIAPEEEHATMVNYARIHLAGERLGFQHARPRRHRCNERRSPARRTPQPRLSVPRCHRAQPGERRARPGA
jgi:PAS domain S-box-containing protein